MQRLNSLQILRFFAAAAVALCHASNMTRAAGLGVGFVPEAIARAGAAGVDVFFVISGAIIYLTAFGRDAPQSPAAFIVKRATKVLPLYWLAGALWCALNWRFVHLDVSPAGYLTTFTLWPAWGRMEPPALWAGWTLSFEMLFYLAAGCCLVWRGALWSLLVGYAVAWALRAAFHWPVAEFLGNPILLEFLAGVLIMRTYSGPRVSPGLGALLTGVAVLAILLPRWPEFLFDFWRTQDGEVSLTRAVVLGLPAALIVWATLQMEGDAKNAVGRALVYLGDASYSLYLTNWMLFMAGSRLLVGTGLSANLVLCTAMPLAILVAVLTHHFVERPLISFCRGLVAPRARPVMVAG